LLDYFKSNAKDVSELLIFDVLMNNKNYKNEIENVIELSKEISEKYEEKSSENR